MAKIKVKTPVVELDGDEMTRIIWGFIKDKLILPYLDIDLKYYDLGIEYRDQTDDQVTVDAANAIRQYGVGVKCATITPDEARVDRIRPEEDVAQPERHHPQHPRRHDLPRADHLQERAAPGAALVQADRHRPPRLWRHLPRDRDARSPGPAGSRCTTSPPTAARRCVMEVHDFKGPGVAMGMHNTSASIEGFARASFNYGLARKYPGLSLDQEHHPQSL